MIEFEFKEIEENNVDIVGRYSEGCSGSRSDCCTRVCTRNDNTSDNESSLETWDKYLEVEAGVLQY